MVIGELFSAGGDQVRLINSKDRKVETTVVLSTTSGKSEE